MVHQWRRKCRYLLTTHSFYKYAHRYRNLSMFTIWKISVFEDMIMYNDVFNAYSQRII